MIDYAGGRSVETQRAHLLSVISGSTVPQRAHLLSVISALISSASQPLNDRLGLRLLLHHTELAAPLQRLARVLKRRCKIAALFFQRCKMEQKHCYVSFPTNFSTKIKRLSIYLCRTIKIA